MQTSLGDSSDASYCFIWEMALFQPLFVTSKKLLPLASDAVESGPLYIIEFLKHAEPLSRKGKNAT